MPDKKKLSRRGFLKNAAIASAAVATGSVLGTTSAQAQTPSSATGLPDKWDYDVDVLVAGAGNGGCTAFMTAASGGAKTLLIEISSVTGGSSLISGAQLHTQNLGTWETYNAGTYFRHDQVLGKVYVETFWNKLIPFLKSKNVAMSQPVPGPAGFGAYRMGRNVDPNNLPSETNVALGAQGHRDYFDSVVNAGKAAGGTVMLKTRALKLYTDDQRRVVGLQASVWSTSPLEKDQKIINIKAKKVILTTGNIYANKGLMTQYVSPYADNTRMYGLNPYQMGDGLVMALDVGAVAGGAWSSWSGSNQAVYPPDTRIATNPDKYEKFITTTDPKTWIQTLQDERPAVPFSGTSITVNLDGKRFLYGIAFQYLGVAFVIADQKAFDTDPTSAAKIAAIKAKGQTVYTANTLDDFATLLSSNVQMNKIGLLNTIAEYNKACDDKTTDKLDPPMAAPVAPATYWKVNTPPFYAVEIASTMYFNMGGLVINSDAQVLDSQRVPIPNLYAAPPCAGGVMRGTYTGGIACAGTFGYLAALHAVANLKG